MFVNESHSELHNFIQFDFQRVAVKMLGEAQ